MKKELRRKTIEWLEAKFGKEVYDDLCLKKSIEEVADYFLENHIVEEIEAMGGLDYALSSWTREFVSSEVMEAENTKEEIEMLQANACAANEGRPLPYSEEDFDEVFRKYHNMYQAKA